MNEISHHSVCLWSDLGLIQTLQRVHDYRSITIT